MPIGNWNLQWLNHNSQRAYPLADWGTGIDRTGTVQIPTDFILALYFPVHAGINVAPDKFYLQTLGIYPTGYSVVIGYDDGTASPPIVANVNIAKSGHTEYRTYALSGADNFDDSVGKIVIGSLASIDLLPPGIYTFEPAATPLETDAITPIIQGVSSLTVVNGTDRSDRITGDIELAAGTNMRIVANLVEGRAPQIVFSAISGEGLNATCNCEGETTGEPIRFINGIPPLSDGNFRIVGSKCLEITPIANGLLFTDSCSQPCCSGSAELDALLQQIQRFATGVTTLENFANTLSGQVTQMNQIVLGSSLGDGACFTCES